MLEVKTLIGRCLKATSVCCTIILLLSLQSCTVFKKKEVALPPMPLLATTWRLTELNKVAVKTKTEKTPYVIFGEDHTFKGFAGCNQMWGIFKWLNDKVQFTNTNRTKIACEDLSIEADFIEMLEASDHYLISGHELYLISNSKIVAKFLAVTK